MLHALLHGKLHGELKRHPRDIEDLLTSVVFGACAYSASVSAELLRFLGLARSFDGVVLAPALEDVREATFEFWPSWEPLVGPSGTLAEGGEPDLVLRMTDGRGRRSLLLVEAKLRSGKSSWPTPGGPVADQLGKYWLGTQALARSEERQAVGVVYLTAGTAAPLSDFVGTQDELQRKGHAPAPLHWLSWRQFVGAVGEASTTPILRDAVRLLREVWELLAVEMGEWPAPAGPRKQWAFDVNLLWPRAPEHLSWTFQSDRAQPPRRDDDH